MGALLCCDGCGRTIRHGARDEVKRLRLLVVEPNENIWSPNFGGESWDFCNVGCLATWSVQQETEIVR